MPKPSINSFYRKISDDYKITTLDSIDNLENKKVMVRVDYNVPLDQNYNILDIKRLNASLKTIKYLLQKNASIIIVTHIEINNGLPSTSLLVPYLSKLIGTNIIFEATTIKIVETAKKLKSGEVLLLENIRLLFSEEKQNSPIVAEYLAKISDLYVNDAFSCSHRSHSSISAITRYLPSYAGFGLISELYNLHRYLDHIFQNNKGKKKTMAIIGGAKCNTKIPLLMSLKKKVDILVIVGNIANVIMGITQETGLSYNDIVTIQESLQNENEDNNGNPAKVVFPSDMVCTQDVNGCEKTYVKTIQEIKDIAFHQKVGSNIPKEYYYDIGPSSVKTIFELIDEVDVVIWNGPCGYIENLKYTVATYVIAQYIASATRKGKLQSIIGGGNTIGALQHIGIIEEMSYISDGGGAFLAWLENNEIPGIKALQQKQQDQINHST